MTLSRSGEITLSSSPKNANGNLMTKEKNGKRIHILLTGTSPQMTTLKTTIHYRGARLREILMTKKRAQGILKTQSRVRSRRKRLSKKRNGKKPSSLQKAMSEPHRLRPF
jgi:hypothetical protein